MTKPHNAMVVIITPSSANFEIGEGVADPGQHGDKDGAVIARRDIGFENEHVRIGRNGMELDDPERRKCLESTRAT